MGRKVFWGALLCVIVGLSVWLGRPVTRAELGITAQSASQSVCVAPNLTPLIERKQGERGCSEAGGCANPERVAATYLAETYASLAAYRLEKRFLPEKLGTGWQRIEHSALYWSGLGWDVYERRPASGPISVMVAFRGTDTWYGYVPYLNDTIANLSTVTQFINPWDQYRQARAAFQDIRTKAIARAGGRPVSFVLTGHSLGGGLAKHVALGFPCTAAVVLNSSCIANGWRYKEPYPAEIVGIDEDRDWLSSSICGPLERAFGSVRRRTYETNWVRNNAQDLAAEITLTLEQHSARRAAAGMTRGVLCCAHRERQNPGQAACDCASDVVSALPQARAVFCSEGAGDQAGAEGRARLQNRQQTICNFTGNAESLPRRAQNNQRAQCPSVCGGLGAGRGDGTGGGVQHK